MKSNVVVLSVAAVLTLVLAALQPSWAGGTRVRQLRTAQDFAEGEADGVAVRELGGLVPGRAFLRSELAARCVWSLAPAGEGGFVLATAEPGGLYRLSGSRATPVETSGNELGYTLAAAPDGTVYAGALTGGSLRALGRACGPVARPALPAGSIWAMTCDGAGNLYVNTGPRGILYRIDPSGKAVEWFLSGEYNLLALAVDSDGRLLTGSGERGNIYAVSDRGKAEVWYHFEDEEEVRGLVATAGTVYAAVNGRDGGREPGEPVSAAGRRDRRTAGHREPRDGTGLRPTDSEDDESPGPVRQAGDEAGDLLPGESDLLKDTSELTGRVYAVDRARRVELLASFPDEFVLCLARESDGGLLVGTGPRGRLYRLDPATGEKLVLHQAVQAHVLCLALSDGRLAAAGTGDGACVLASCPPGPVGTWTSPVQDSGAPARFGALKAHGAGSVQVFTRTGNTPQPDERWSVWSGPRGLGTAPISSPAGRYLQLRVELATGPVRPRVEDLTFFHAGPNHKPRIESLTVGAPESDATTSAGESDPLDAAVLDTALELDAPLSPARARGGGAKGKRAHKALDGAFVPVELELRWEARDADDDELVYRLSVLDTGLGEGAPRLPLNRGEPLEKTDYLWDTATVPDGRYLVEVEASDERSNPAGTALTGARLSETVIVDNTRPVLASFQIDGGRVRGRARDDGSGIAAVAWSADGGPWTPVPAADGLFDGNEEAFEFPPPDLRSGQHILTVRATDAHGNAVMAHRVVQGTR